MAGTLEQKIEAYDRHHVLDNRLTAEWYPRRIVAMANTGSMLELGLGHGYSARYFADVFDRYTVVEGSQQMIDRFRSDNLIENMDIQFGYFEDFETDEKFDAIGMGFVLEHVDNPSLIVRRFAKFLAPDGLMFIAVPNAESLHRRFGHEAGLLSDMRSLSEADRDFGHQRYYTLESLRQTIEQEGLVVRKVEGLLLKPFTTAQIMQLNLSESILQSLLKVGVAYPELCNSILMAAGVPDS
jgi:SAM-dependent methyltransferase